MEAVLEATARDSGGKNEARRIRREGRLPAVVYGSTGDSSIDGVADDPQASAPKTSAGQ